MAYRLSVHLIEAASVLLFVWALILARRERPLLFLELVSAFLFGFILEELDIYFFRTYRYGPGFILQVHEAPVAIALLWSLILVSSMEISDRLVRHEWARPFADGLLALLIDIGVDAVAIRAGYWTWTIPQTEGWFGVPAGNLYSWMWVAFSFSLLTRVVRRLAAADAGRRAYQFIVPFAAYLFLFVEIMAVGIFSAKLGFKSESERLWIFYGHVFFFAALAWRGRPGKVRGTKPPLKVFGLSRLAIHVFFLAALVAMNLPSRMPALAAVAVLAFAAEVLIQRVSGNSSS